MIAWLLLYHLPEKHPWITAEELEKIRGPERAADAAVQPKTRWLDLLGLPQTWGLFFARFLSSPVWWFYLFWLPKYLVEQRGFNMIQLGMLAWLPYLSADLGSICGGLASGWLVNRQWKVMRARKAIMLPAALLMPLSVVIAFSNSTPVAFVIICTVTFAHMAWMTNLMTVTNDIYPKRVVGSVAGIAAFGNGLGGAIFTGITGYVVQAFSYNGIFIIMGFLHPAAFVLFKLLVDRPMRSDK